MFSESDFAQNSFFRILISFIQRGGERSSMGLKLSRRQKPTPHPTLEPVVLEI
jgi:hypothetical protein